MALILNPWTHNAAGNATGGILSMIKTRMDSSNLTTVKVYPASVAYPAIANRVAGTAVTGFLGSTTFTAISLSGGNLIGTIGGTFTPTVTGTAAWVYVGFSNGSTEGFFTDSVGLPGSGSIITLTTLSLVSGTPVTLALSLKA